MESTRIRDVFEAVAASFMPGDTTVDVFDHLIQAATTFTSATAAGIVLADIHGHLHVAASSSERTKDVEEAQLGASEGPALDCHAGGKPVEVADLSLAANRWPTFTAVAKESGFTSVTALPLRFRDDTLGSLCLFGTGKDGLSDEDVALGQAMADAATLTLIHQRVIEQQRTLNEQLQTALEDRIIIEQAKGALSARLGIPANDAFEVLRRQSRNSKKPLRVVAAQVMDHGSPAPLNASP